MLRFVLRVFGFLFSWLAIGSLAALAALAAVFVIYGRDLPDYAQLSNYEPPTLSLIYSGEGDLMDEFARERRVFTPIYEIPDLVKDAFISAEDKNFYQHKGFDPRGIAAAIYQAAMEGGRLRGASTITQQVMKNFLLTGDRSGERKIKEIILATRLERTLSKDQILELYLNEIFLGQNSYGVTAAAEVYFNKSLEELSLAETAYLAALPQAPSVLHPVREKARAIARRNYVLDQMALEQAHFDAAPQAFFEAWKRGAQIAGHEWFGDGTREGLQRATTKWDLRPNMLMLNDALGVLSSGQRMFLSAMVSFYNAREGGAMLKRCGFEGLSDFGGLDLERRQVIADLTLHYNGW